MGRHASPSPASEAPRPPATASLVARRLRAAAVLAGTAFLTTTLVVAWAGNAWSTASLVGLGAAVVVALATWLAATVPGPPEAPTGRREDQADGPHAVQ